MQWGRGNIYSYLCTFLSFTLFFSLFLSLSFLFLFSFFFVSAHVYLFLFLSFFFSSFLAGGGSLWHFFFFFFRSSVSFSIPSSLDHFQFFFHQFFFSSWPRHHCDVTASAPTCYINFSNHFTSLRPVINLWSR